LLGTNVLRGIFPSSFDPGFVPENASVPAPSSAVPPVPGRTTGAQELNRTIESAVGILSQQANRTVNSGTTLLPSGNRPIEINEYGNVRGTYNPPSFQPSPPAPPPPVPAPPAQGPKPGQNSVVHVENLSNMNSEANSQAGSPAPGSASSASSASSVGNNLQQLDMNFFENNPSNFQEGHMRIHFNADPNKRVSANTRIGQYRTRISGRNAANLKNKYNSRKANLNRKVETAKKELSRLQREEEEKRKANQNALNAARNAREEAKRTLKQAEATAKAVAKSKATAKQTLKQTTITGTKTLAQKQEELRQAEIAAGKSKTIRNRFMGFFKRGGNKTRRANRRGTSRRRRN
jgi:hypothetical protein